VNDENLLLIERDGDLASQYADHIIQVYSQYRWRQSVQTQQGKPSWGGLADNEKWQSGAPRIGPSRRQAASTRAAYHLFRVAHIAPRQYRKQTCKLRDQVATIATLTGQGR
jgi:hypothetical protein